MKIERIPYSPGELVDFYEEALTSSGAVCERTWHDRLQVLAEGSVAALWNVDGALHEVELFFAPADAHAARDASREVFPGSPLTFGLSESLRPKPLPLERAVLAIDHANDVPAVDVLEKVWRSQFSQTGRWRLTSELKRGFHFSLLSLIRCEIQTIDQHWSLRRVAVALPGGELDDSLATSISYATLGTADASGSWPNMDAGTCRVLLCAALETDLAQELADIRARQEQYLRRELERIDDYFAKYEQELKARSSRGSSEQSKIRIQERLSAAEAEHARRRADQVHRHEVRVVPHFDALLLIAEPAWTTRLEVNEAHTTTCVDACYVPRARRWFKIA